MIENSEIGLRAIPDWLLRGADMRVPCDKYRMVWIGADGTVQLCYVTFHLGNLHQHRLRELLYTETHEQAAARRVQLAVSELPLRVRRANPQALAKSAPLRPAVVVCRAADDAPRHNPHV
jgi:hypothetical protein